TLRVRHGGSGYPVLLLHGHPRTHATWHRVAPLLASEHSVVCPDLRGYGRSSKPPATAGHASYSKRAMAGDCLTLMRELGYERFAVVGHDRGAYVAFRLAMDHPEVVSHLMIADAVPIGEALARCDARFARLWWHWFFLGSPEAEAHRVISADPDAWYHSKDERQQMGEENWADYLTAIRDPATVLAMCEDYRAGLGIDREHDDADRATGRRVGCPTRVVWASRDDMEDLYGDMVGVWRAWADNVSGAPIESGHHIAEEAPGPFAAEIAALVAR
ncbi:MAG TPA: alpha/beta hydrolase, partial [Streptosporangiaceae bacterium]|nr:alpha/beta hydrolase [Streptosporangiaceae bacterium]